MYLLSWILVGLVAGWLGGKILKGDGYGTVMDITMGIGEQWRAAFSCNPQA